MQRVWICLLAYLNHRDVCVFSQSWCVFRAGVFALCGRAPPVVWNWAFDFSQSWVIRTYFLSEALELLTFMFAFDKHFVELCCGIVHLQLNKHFTAQRNQSSSVHSEQLRAPCRCLAFEHLHCACWPRLSIKQCGRNCGFLCFFSIEKHFQSTQMLSFSNNSCNTTV